MKEKFEAIVYGLHGGEMVVKKTEPSDMVLVMAFDEKDNNRIITKGIGVGSPLGGAVITPMAEAIAGTFKRLSDDPKTVAHLMDDFREALEEECAEYVLQHFAEIFGEAEQ